MKFKSKKIDLTLELEGLDGTQKKYFFNGDGVVNERIGSKLAKEFQMFEKANDDVPESEQKSKPEIIVYELKMVYPDLDKEWLRDNFTLGELSDIIRWVSLGMAGLKND